MPTEQELIARIKELESELARTKKQKRYGLVWEDKKEDVVERCKHELPVLVADESKTLSDDPNGPTHILIEGDNFHALSVLAYTHAGKVDVIYIDPPYNTGNNSWKYNNNYVDKDDAYRHSKWLTMMEKRLKVAKDLLSDTGVIFVAIDDYEIHTIRCLLDEIFNEDNRLGNIVVVHNPGGRDDDRFVATAHEYMLIYSKNIDEANLKLMMLTEDQILEYKLEDTIGKYKLQSFTRTGSNSRPSDRPKLHYPIYYNPNTEKLSLSKESDDYEEILPLDGSNIPRVWRWGKETFDKNKNTEFVISRFKGKYIIKVKKRLNFGDDEGSKAKSFWFNPKYSASTHGTLLLEKILGKSKAFSYPKSLFTVKDALYLATQKQSIVLDFFAGSGTTGHAVLALNQEDGGNRKFILCTNNEVGSKDEQGFKEQYGINESELKIWQSTNKKEWVDWSNIYGICSSVTYPRIHNVIKGYADVEGIPANLRYYRTDFISHDKSIDDLRHKFILRCSEMLQIRESCFDVSALNGDEYFQVFENKDLVLAILYHPYEIKRLREIISQTEKPIVAYIFSMGMEIFQEELAEYGDKVRIETVPDEILETYKKIFGF